HITYLVWGILGLVLVAAWPEVMLFMIFAFYAMLGPVERVIGVLGKLAGKQAQSKRDLPAAE
ncbi:MAG: hypothetical protein ACM34B_02805, partial [Nitrospira sp.]